MRLWALATVLCCASSLTPADNLSLLFSQMSRRIERFTGNQADFQPLLNYFDTDALPTLKGIVASLPPETESFAAAVSQRSLARAVFLLEGFCSIPQKNGLPDIWESVKKELETAQMQLGTSTMSRLRVWLNSIFS